MIGLHVTATVSKLSTNAKRGTTTNFSIAQTCSVQSKVDRGVTRADNSMFDIAARSLVAIMSRRPTGARGGRGNI